MRAFPAALLALAIALPASAAPAAKPAAAKAGAGGVNDDVRCMLAMVAYSNLNRQNPQAGQVGVYFFAGRIAARAPGFDLNAAVKAQAASLGPQQLQAEIQRCGPIVNAASERFQAAINGLRPPGPPAAAAPAAPAAVPPAGLPPVAPK